MDISSLIIKMVVFFVLLLTGYLSVRKGYISDFFVKDGSRLLINIFLVASIINSVLGDRPDLNRSEIITAVLLTSFVEICCYVLAFIFARFFKNENNCAQTELMLSVTNSLFVGLPAVASVFGSEAVFYVGLSCIPYNLILYSYGIWNLKKGNGKIHIKDMITLPLIASILALFIFLINPPVPKVFSDLISTTAAGTVPLSMIVIGASLGKINPISAFKEKRFYFLSFVRLILCPVITFLIVRLFTDNIVLIASCIVLSGCPTAVIVTPISVQYGYDPVYSSKMVMISTLLSMVTIPVLLKVLLH